MLYTIGRRCSVVIRCCSGTRFQDVTGMNRNGVQEKGVRGLKGRPSKAMFKEVMDDTR